ncbi:hypothetical protein A5320_03920 [Rheinheimera sp. SA_1]|uniref:non-ribosomal peptide synthetase n=1 Tax=Rheinheimera sp. SA_1 TaxID=1827365 RepID=UPI0008014B70|nr:non-ribosomal peptide synthetase [Rheinheimera sp. SA_1]OBP16553.1 hypothetical protein A5320_03920 [Rheinheimera sp. SA_1]
MNLTEQIIALCAEQGVSLAVQDSKLEVVFDDMPTESLLQQLRQYKSELIDYLLQHQHRQQSTRITALHEQTAPLSFGQRRLWYIDQLEQGSAHYNMSVALELNGPLELTLLKNALHTLVSRHEILRTTYDSSGTRQIIQPQAQMPMCELDWSDQPSEQQLADLFVSEQLLPFVLTTEIPIRVTLVKLAEQRHVLLLIVHHIACDGLSLGIIVQELASCYRDLLAGDPLSLPSLTVQYSDYAYWQQANQDLFEQQLGFWRSHLAEAPAIHRLSTDRPRPPQQSFTGDCVSTKLSAEVVSQIHHCCQQFDVTPFMLCYSVFALLIARYSDEQDVLIGCPVANRHQSVIEPLVGYFANTVVMRSRLQAGHTFSQLLAETKTMVLDVFQHQEVPFEMVVERVQPERNLAYSPLFQLMFSFHSHGKAELSLSGLQLAELSLKAKTVKTDLELAITVTADGYQLDWNFSTALFDASSLARLAASYAVLLQAVLADPARALAVYPVMQASDETLLQQWGGLKPADRQAVQGIQEQTLHQLFTNSVQRQPDKIALQCEGRQLTYLQLDGLSDQVACYLQAQGVSAGQVVAVEMGRTEWLVVALLGVLKAGACYLPLEPGYPQHRLDYMRQDSQVSLTLNDAVVEQVISGVAMSAAQQMPVVDGQSLAYILYTSGSTGQPKGVMVSHHSAVHFLQTMAAQLQGGGTWLAVTGVAFDISVLEIFGSLAFGLTLVLWSPDQSQSVAEAIVTNRVSHLQCTPSFAQMHLSGLAAKHQLQSLQQLYIGGEVFPPMLAEQLLQLTSAQIHNMYGPTETTVWATSYQVQSHVAAIPLGKPLPGYQLKVLGQDAQLLPPGAAGELYIGGPGVAAGYLNQPELTRQRFVQCPNTQSCWYRTGDKVRWMQDGQLQFLGRLDAQIKLRGHRIEPDEIAMQLSKHPSVSTSVVLLEQLAQEGARLVAYIQPASWPIAEAELINQCKTFLAQQLPSYMIPAAFMVLEKLPLTLNGKLNKAALPSSQNLAVSQNFRGPQSETEHALVLIWAELLAVPAAQINCQSSFFDLGGHSILLTRLLAALQEQFGLRLTIREVFEHANIESLAVIIDQRQLPAGGDTFNLLSQTDVGQSEEFIL